MSADQPEWTAPPEAVIAFLDGDGCDDEAFASLRRRLTLATPWILDSAAGTDYTARKLAEAEKRGAERATAATVMGGQRFAVVWGLREAAAAWRANGLAWDDPDEETNMDLRVARSLDARADRIERGEQA